jgi:hypothetical protein
LDAVAQHRRRRPRYPECGYGGIGSTRYNGGR